ncbi:hypothetical protein FB451DRAFT_1375340 [Mycena latifolia]|nr:hypothetical protein FB451DRAFT_1375340 [Mycena latifolia]
MDLRISHFRLPNQLQPMSHSITGAPPLVNGSEMPHVLIYIDISCGVAEQFHEVPSEPWAESQNIIHVSRHPRRHPAVIFMSSSPILAKSQFPVWTDHIVHTETAVPLTSVVDNRFPDATFLHRVPLIPGYWQTIVESPDLIRYTILHQVTEINNPAVIFSAKCCFRYMA